jgi:hypothetical protein
MRGRNLPVSGLSAHEEFGVRREIFQFLGEFLRQIENSTTISLAGLRS